MVFMGGRAAFKLLGLLLASSVMPATGIATLPAESDQPTAAVSDVAATLSSPSLPDYNQSDLNGGSRGFEAAHLTVNQSLPAELLASR